MLIEFLTRFERETLRAEYWLDNCALFGLRIKNIALNTWGNARVLVDKIVGSTGQRSLQLPFSVSKCPPCDPQKRYV